MKGKEDCGPGSDPREGGKGWRKKGLVVGRAAWDSARSRMPFASDGPRYWSSNQISTYKVKHSTVCCWCAVVDGPAQEVAEEHGGLEHGRRD
jgi:hypothetical protein